VIGEEHVTTTWRQSCWKKVEVADDHGVCDPLVVHCVRLRVGNPQPRRE